MAEKIEESLYELLLEAGKAIASEVELEALVQKITDVGREISNAQFGAFFYNVTSERGEKYVLYTISGVPKEAFSKFPMPRNTAIFHPTFAGLHTVRYDDVTLQEHYGQTGPHFGMPKGHLPVKSYLATSVIDPHTKEVIGGLFFGHSNAGVFTEKTETIIEGIAVQAAIAMGNARLFEEKKRAERTLQEQKEQYRSIFQATTDAMIIFNDAGEVVEANMAARELLLYLEDLNTLKGEDLFEQSGDLFKAIDSIVKSGRKFQGLGKVKARSKELLDVRITATHYLHNNRTHLLIVLRKIETDKNIEEALVKSESFAHTITNVSPVTLWMTNERGETIYFNQAWIDMVGGQMEDFFGTGWLNVIVAEDRHKVEQAFTKAFKNKTVFGYDFRINKRDGSTRWCSTYGSPYYLPNGAFGGYAGSVSDITERKSVEERLASQNNLINTIANNTMQALFLMDARQHCTYMNPAAESMIGFKLEEVQDKPLHYYIHHTHPNGQHFPIEDCAIDRALPTRMQTKGIEVFIRKSGEFFPVAFVASPIIENGQPVGTVIEVRDTTEENRIQQALHQKEKETMSLLEQKVRERTSELEKSNYELLQFTSVASHDLKEPVRKVSIFSQRMKEMAKSIPDSKFQGYLDNIIRSSGRMARLIDDLLAFARLSQAREAFGPVDLNLLIEQIKDDLQIAMDDKRATIVSDTLPVINGTEFQLGQVFQNLISNSLKFAHPDRSPLIQIRYKAEDNNHLIIYTDNGIGFRNEMSEKIFNIFERLHSKDEYEGTGIGLSIVKKIVDLHGGDISASGASGEGAQFYISFPVTE